MRVVFFLQGDRVPAARARGFQVIRRLEAAGVRCEIRVPYPSVYGDTRLGWPLSRLRPLFRPASVWSRLAGLRGLRPDDVVFFQRPLVELPTTALERLAARGRRVVFDFDDAIYLDFGAGAKFRALVDLADQVIAGNRTLAEAAAAPQKTTVIPTVVDTGRFAPQARRPIRDREVVVGWTGLRGNYRQLLVARRGLGRALQRTGARLLLISNAPPPKALRALDPIYVRWSPENEIRDLARMDIGIMPLPDTPFARGKCAYKLIQYMALGLAAVASPVGANREVVTDGVDGCLAADDEAWENALVRLISDPSLRERIGAAARRRIEDAYSLDAVVPRYLEVLARVGIVPAPARAEAAAS